MDMDDWGGNDERGRTWWYQNAPYGVMNQTANMNSSLFLSKYYFADASPDFLKMVTMPSPKDSPDELEFAYNVDPLSGAMFSTNYRVQINMQLDPALYARR